MEVFPTANRIRYAGRRVVIWSCLTGSGFLSLGAYHYLAANLNPPVSPFPLLGTLAAICFLVAFAGFRLSTKSTSWENAVREGRHLTCVRCDERALTVVQSGRESVYLIGDISKVHLSYPILCVRVKGLRLDGKFRMGWYERADLERVIKFIESTKSPLAAP